MLFGSERVGEVGGLLLVGGVGDLLGDDMGEAALGVAFDESVTLGRFNNTDLLCLSVCRTDSVGLSIILSVCLSVYLSVCPYICLQRRTGAETIGGSTPNLQSDGIYSPKKKRLTKPLEYSSFLH